MACDWENVGIGRNGKPKFCCKKCNAKVACDTPPKIPCKADEADMQSLAEEWERQKKQLEEKFPQLKYSSGYSQPANTWPTISEQVQSVAGAVARFAKNPSWVTDEQFEERMAICDGCEFIKNTVLGKRCGKCACFLTAKLVGKARLATESCPMGKWPKHENEPTVG